MSLSAFSQAPARIDAAIDKALADKRIVGAVVLVARDGKVIHRRAAGWSNRESRTPMREDAIFRLASVSKPFVTAAAMRLVEEEWLDLDTPVTQWLPDFRPALADGSRPEITIRHLMTHTSGLGYSFLEHSDGPYHKLNVSDGLDQPGLSLDENLARLAATPLHFAPGTSWLYSLGIDVLGGVLEKVTGQSLPEIVQQKVTAPLGLADTGFAVQNLSRLASSYADGNPEPVQMTDGMAVVQQGFEGLVAVFAPSRILDAASYPSGGAGMAGTADDLLRFLEAIRTGGAPILKTASVEEMVRDQVGTQAETQGPGWGFGYGWAVLDDPSPTGTPQAPGTLQWGGAYGHSWFVDRTNALSVVALTNTASEGVTGSFPGEIRNAVYG